MRRTFLVLAVACCLEAGAGCQNEPAPQAAANEAPAVPVSVPVEREVTDYVDFTGRTDAVQSVDIRPRVTGYLIRMPFREGSEVKAGDLLFEIDPRPYQAQLDQSQSQVALNEASLKLARSTYERDRAIAISTPGGVAAQQLDEDRAAIDEAVARVKASQAATEVYKLNLSFTRVTSPVDGLVSRYYLTVGNLVNQDSTLLTTVVSLDPMYAYFDMDEPTLLRIRKAIAEGRISLNSSGVMPVLMGLQGEEGYPHPGTVNFVNNQVNPTTGSISVRGIFANPKSRRTVPAAALPGLVAPTSGAAGLPRAVASTGAALLSVPPLAGDRLLSPGMFVRIRLPIGEPHPALLVIDRAISSDQGLKFVYVLDGDNKAQYRRITTGPLQEDGLRVVTDGLHPEDRVVVGGLPQVRPKMEVRPEVIPMPSLARQPPSDGTPADAGGRRPRAAEKGAP
jgi:multidrug efflux system membrane fusion protein